MARPAGHRLNRSAWEDVLALKGLSLTQVAELSRVPRPTLSALLGGHNQASVPKAHQLADSLGVKAATLFPSLDAGFVSLSKNEVAELSEEDAA